MKTSHPNNLPPESKSGHTYLWFLFGLIPIPIGLLAGPAKLFESSHAGTHGIYMLFAILTFSITLIAGSFLSRGRDVKGLNVIFLAIFIGAWIGVMDLSIIWFTGCCSSFSNTH